MCLSRQESVRTSVFRDKSRTSVSHERSLSGHLSLDTEVYQARSLQRFFQATLKVQLTRSVALSINNAKESFYIESFLPPLPLDKIYRVRQERD